MQQATGPMAWTHNEAEGSEKGPPGARRNGAVEPGVDARSAAQAVKAQAALTHETSRKRRTKAQLECDRAADVRRSLIDRGNGSRPATTRTPARDYEIACILEEDPDLAQGLPPEVRRAATHAFRARVISVAGANWDPPQLDERMTYGFLLLDGLLARRIRIGRAHSTELLGRGDILRPWEEPCLGDTIPPKVEWRVIRPSRLAVLDERITRLIGTRPELVIAFSNRLFRRARCAEYLTAVSRFRHVEDRLLATLWHMASNWGHVTPRGVKVPFHLTHAALGQIIGAQRPSVTTAMRQLGRRGQVSSDENGDYVLTGEPADLLRAWA